jgi:transcriptional regulator with XRE-family HTH domain
MIDNIEIFRKNLKYHRKKRGYSLSDLSKITGLSIRMLSYYELYATNIPIDKLQVISNGLKISINDLLETKDAKKKDVELKDLIDIDSRTLQKIKELLSLTPQDRAMVYSLISNLAEMRKYKKQKQIQDLNK